jgi:sugar phosphate permease
MTRVIADWTPPTRRSFMQGLTHSFVSIGTTATPPLIAWIMGYVGWRGAFLMLGGLSIVWVIVWAWRFRDDPRTDPAVTQAELSQLVFTRKEKAKAPWGRLIPAMLPPAIVYMCLSATFWTFWTWLPTYFARSYHLVLQQSAIFTFGVLFAGVFGDITGGWLSDAIYRRTGNLRIARCGLIAVALVLAAACIGPVLFIRDLNLAALALASGFFFIRASVSPTWAICTDIAPAWAGSAGGMLNTGSAISSIAAPLAFGFIADWSGNYSTPFSASLILLLVGAGMCLVMRPDRQVRDEG